MAKNKKTLITSKGDGKHFYAYQQYWKREQKIWECVKIKGRYYLAKLVLGEGLKTVGEPLIDFTLLK
jgi:hypothetical protein